MSARVGEILKVKAARPGQLASRGETVWRVMCLVYHERKCSPEEAASSRSDFSAACQGPSRLRGLYLKHGRESCAGNAILARRGSRDRWELCVRVGYAVVGDR